MRAGMNERNSETLLRSVSQCLLPTRPMSALSPMTEDPVRVNTTSPARCSFLLAVKSVAFPRRRLVHGFTKRFRRNAALGRDPRNVLSCRVESGRQAMTGRLGRR